MKLIFLDIDGVLNNPKSAEKFGTFNILDAECVSVLRNLVILNNASIVISSTWRGFDNWHDKISGAISNAGWTEARHFIVDRTPFSAESIRSNEIMSWLTNNKSLLPWKEFIAIDDDNFDMDGIPLIKADPELGLQKSDLISLINHGWAI